MRERVRPPRELERVLDELKGPVFDTKQKGMMFAASVGYALCGDKVDEVVIEEYGEGIRMEYFRSKASPQDADFIDAMTVHHSNDLTLIDSELQPERVERFERYVFLGLKEMQRACFDERPENPLHGILNLMDAMTTAQSEDLPGIDDLGEQLDQFL